MVALKFDVTSVESTLMSVPPGKIFELHQVIMEDKSGAANELTLKDSFTYWDGSSFTSGSVTRFVNGIGANASDDVRLPKPARFVGDIKGVSTGDMTVTLIGEFV